MSEAFRTNLKNEWSKGFCCNKKPLKKSPTMRRTTKRDMSTQSVRKSRLLSSYFVDNKNRLSQIDMGASPNSGIVLATEVKINDKGAPSGNVNKKAFNNKLDY